MQAYSSLVMFACLPARRESDHKKCPPSAALHAFEEATRHTTFTAAAEELHITQSAVIHQLKHLGEIWGVIPTGQSIAP